MTDINARFRRTEETKPITERAAYKRGWTVAKYVFLTACGFLLYRVGSALAFTERGYEATGGEVFFLFLPLFYLVFSVMVRDARRDIKNFKEKTENETSL